MRLFRVYDTMCWLPLRKTNFSKLGPGDSLDLLGLRMSLPRENSRSTAAEDGIGVLYFRKRLVRISSPMKSESTMPSFPSMSSQVSTSFLAFCLTLVREPVAVHPAKRSSCMLLSSELVVLSPFRSLTTLSALSTSSSMAALTETVRFLSYLCSQWSRNFGWKAAASWQSRSFR